MTTRVYRPLYAGIRRHPLAHQIARELLKAPAILALRTRRLEADIRARFEVAACTARTAISIARRSS